MEFDEIDCRGEFKVDRVSSLPAWNSAYEGRMLYTDNTDRLYIGINSAWRLIAKTTDNVDLTATAAEINTACDGITATATDLNYLDGITEPLIESVMIKNLVNRPRFTRKDNDEIYIGPGAYYHYGTTEQVVYWNSQITKALTGSGSGFHYLYLDDSAIVSGGSPLLTASEFTWDTTAPTWSNAKHGWYHPTATNDRCIFVIRGVIGVWWTTITRFWHDGGRYVEWDERVEDYELTTIPKGTWLSFTVTLPDFGDESQGHLTFFTQQNSDQQSEELYYRKEGSSSSGNVVAFEYDWGQQDSVNSRITTVDGTRSLELKYNTAVENTNVRLHTNGYYLPRGM